MIPGARGELADVLGPADECLQLGGEEEALAGSAVVHWLDADGVSGQEQVVAIGDGQAEHAVEPVDGLGPALAVEVQGGLGVTLSLEDMSILELVADRRGVVDLAVGDDHAGGAGGLDRLLAPFDVHDREPAMAEPAAPRRVIGPFVVRPAMHQGVHHRPDRVSAVGAGIPGACNSTHREIFTFSSENGHDRRGPERALMPHRRQFNVFLE